jgi:dihydropyrimidinase
LSVVSTDHVAFRRADKEVEHWWVSSFGVNGLRTSLSVFHDEVVNESAPSPFGRRSMATVPAAVLITARKRGPLRRIGDPS